MPLTNAKLEELLKQGYQLLPVLREQIPLEEVEGKLPEEYVAQAQAGNLKAAILQNPGEQGILYFFFDEPTLRLVQGMIDDAHTNATATVFVTFGISFLQLGNSDHYNLDNVVASFKQVYGWDVKPSYLGHNLFDFLLVDQPAGEDALKALKLDIEQKLLLLSLLYRAGIYVHRFHERIIPRGLPPYGEGPEESAGAGFGAADVERLAPVLASSKARRAAHGLQAFYRQTTKVGRLALGWMLLEDLFGNTSGYQHILSDDEQDAVEKLITDSPNIDTEKKPAVIARFRDISAFRKSRNEIIAERIADVRGEDATVTYQAIRKLSKERAKVLHSFKTEADIEVTEWERFVEETVLQYIRRESGISVMRLRGH